MHAPVTFGALTGPLVVRDPVYTRVHAYVTGWQRAQLGLAGLLVDFSPRLGWLCALLSWQLRVSPGARTVACVGSAKQTRIRTPLGASD